MHRATLLVHRFLVENPDAVAPGFHEVPVDLTETQTLPNLLRSLEIDYPQLTQAVYDGTTNTMRPGLMVVVNDRIVHPHECSQLVIRDGDEVTFFPMIDGG